MYKNTILKGLLPLAASAVMCSAHVQARQSTSVIATHISNEKRAHTTTAYTLFERSAQHDAQVDHEISNVIYLKLNSENLDALMRSADPLISFELPAQLTGGLQQFTLNKFDILDRNFKVYEVGADGLKKEAKVPTGIFYRGIIEQSDRSLAAFSFAQGEVAAVFSTIDGGNYNLVLNYHNPGADHENYILFRDSDIRNGHRVPCAVSDAQDQVSKTPGNTAAKGTFNSCHKVRISMHGDYRLYLKSASDLTRATNYLTALFNVDAALFNNEGINTVLSEVVVNTAQDGYTYGSSNDVLDKFGAVTQSAFDGDITQLVSGYNQGGYPPLGGLAWLDVLCQAPAQYVQNNDTFWYGPFSMVDNYIMDSIPQVPVYSWDAEASTHEMGHNIGSPHTHSCSWPGGAIDDCYTPEGSCSPGPHPNFNTGTIMSYCHLDPSVGINFVYGFGPLPGALIRDNVASRSCLTSSDLSNTLTIANTERIANRQCGDGDWTYFYYDNNTATEADDELLLMVNPNGQSIGNVDVTGMTVKMTTQSYGGNTARSVAAPYAINGWKEINRTWQVVLPDTIAQPAANVTVRFPYTSQDVADIQGSFSGATETTLKAVAFKNSAAAANPVTATSSDVNYYTYSAGTASATQWKKGTEGNYNYAEFVTNFGLFGGSIGFSSNSGTGIHDTRVGSSLDIYPNPAASVLNIRMPEQLKASGAFFAITDNMGRSILAPVVTKADGSATLNISGLSAGVYCLRVIAGTQTFSGFFVKQ